MIRPKIKIYLSGGMQDIPFEDSNFWRQQVQSYFWNKYKGEIEVFNPNDHFNFAESPIYQTEREVMELDLYHLRNSDIVLYNANNPKSLGSMAELAIAYEMKKPIFIVNEDSKTLHSWIKNFGNRTFYKLREACDYIIEHYIEV